MIKAEIIADSKNEFGNRLTTFLVTFPRIILTEVNTHRALSRNSASSRAIPFEKMLERVQNDPFIPIKWMKDHKGMQGNEYFEDTNKLKNSWLEARDKVVSHAKHLSGYGLTKQIVNRLLEPFMWHTAIITATEWENFFALRAHEAAEIHLQDLAYKMLEEYNKSTPKELKAGEWHIPFGNTFDENKIVNLSKRLGVIPDSLPIKIATARCARLSYLNFEGKDDYEADIKLHDSLEKAGHVSPFEHCAKAMSKGEFDNSFHKGDSGDGPDFYFNGWSGNFRGFVQYRKLLKEENRTDNRVIKK